MPTLSADTATEARKVRALAVLGAAIAALLVWAVATAIVPDLRQPAFGAAEPQELSAAVVTVAAAAGGLLGWGVMALFERFTARARRAWLVVAPLALVFSFTGPLSGDGISGANRLALVFMHVAVATVVIPSYYWSSPVDAAARKGM